MIAQHDATAQQTGARIVIHCGNDCIPWDLTVFQMHKHAQSKGAALVEAQTYGEFGDAFGASGGTLTTASGGSRGELPKGSFPADDVAQAAKLA